MTEYTCASGFSGGGGFDIGAKAAGFTPICANEHDPKIAASYVENMGDHIFVCDFLKLRPYCLDCRLFCGSGCVTSLKEHTGHRVEIVRGHPALMWKRTDLIHFSPPCVEFSAAKSGGKEGWIERAFAVRIAEFIAVLKPRWFTLENVRAYKKSASFAIICKALAENGYWYDSPVLNSADFLVPQTRQRLFLRAVRGGLVPPLPPPTRWVGWLEAIADILDTLPESEFAEWQLKRLGAAAEKGQTVSPEFFVGGANKSESFLSFAVENRPNIPGIKNADEPMATIPADAPTVNAGRAFLVDCVCRTNGPLTTRQDDEPSHTIAASHMRNEANVARAFLVDGKLSTSGDDKVLQVVDESSPVGAVVSADSYRRDTRAFLVESKNANQQYGDGIRLETEPDTTVVTDHKLSHQPTAFILEGPTDGKDIVVRILDNKPPPHAWLSQGRVVKMTPRALARFQSFPDWYKLPEKAALACRIIGNAVPPLMAEAICRSLIR